MSARASTYRYFGLLFGRVSAKVQIDEATFGSDGGHAAVWLGVNSPGNKTWVQGGVEVESSDDRCFAYTEVLDGTYKIERWPINYGTVVKVRLVRKRGEWRVIVRWPGHHHESRLVRVDHAQDVATLETFGPVRAVGWINRRKVQANTLDVPPANG